MAEFRYGSQRSAVSGDLSNEAADCLRIERLTVLVDRAIGAARSKKSRPGGVREDSGRCCAGPGERLPAGGRNSLTLDAAEGSFPSRQAYKITSPNSAPGLVLQTLETGIGSKANWEECRPGASFPELVFASMAICSEDSVTHDDRGLVTLGHRA